MNWKAVIALSSYGIVLGTGIVLGYLKENTLLRLVIILLYPFWIGIKIGKRPFLHALLIGIIGDYIALIIKLLFSSNPFLKEEYSVPFSVSVTLMYGMTMGGFIGLFSWAVRDLKSYVRSIYFQIKKKKISAPAQSIVSILVALLSFLGCIYFFGSSLASCAGHGPRYEKFTFLGHPLFLMAATLFFYLLGRWLLGLSYRLKGGNHIEKGEHREGG